MLKDLKKPCEACPFRKESAPGWTGNATPEEFLDTTMCDRTMPCHLTVDYENPYWEDDLDLSQQCAGAAIFFTNICKLSRDPDRLKLPADSSVFGTLQKYLLHHAGRPKPRP